MVITPVDAVLAIAEPEIVPVNAEEITATKAAPPRNRPATTLEIIRSTRYHQESSENHEQGDVRRRDRGDDAKHPLIVV